MGSRRERLRKTERERERERERKRERESPLFLVTWRDAFTRDTMLREKIDIAHVQERRREGFYVSVYFLFYFFPLQETLLTSFPLSLLSWVAALLFVSTSSVFRDRRCYDQRDALALCDETHRETPEIMIGRMGLKTPGDQRLRNEEF